MMEWVNKGFPAMHCVYLGRGVEWYGAEYRSCSTG